MQNRTYNSEGVSTDSFITFHTPSEFALQNLFYPEIFGHYCCDSTYRIERQELNNYLLLLTLSGSGTILSSTGKHICRSFDLMLIDCHSPHTYYANENWEFFWLHFQGLSSNALVSYILESGHDQTSVAADSPAFKYFRQILNGSAHTTIESEFYISSLIQSLLSALLHQEKKEIPPATSIDISEAVGYIEQHFTQELRLDQIAQSFWISKSALCHRFKEETGFSPYEYILIKRINYAKYLLQTTSHSVSEISFAVGFQSEANFSQHFKKRTGVSPSAFRQIRL